MSVSKEQGQKVFKEIEEAVNAIFAKHNMDPEKMTFGYGDYFKFTVIANPIVLGANGVNLQSNDAQEYSLFGLKDYETGADLKAPLGTTFTNKGINYVFAGISGKRRKFPITAIEADSRKIVHFGITAINLINKASEAQEVKA